MVLVKEKLLYNEFKDLPLPQYPFPDLVNPEIENLAKEYYEWIESDCGFESPEARETHKRHRLTDIAARAFPRMTMAELRPVARFTAFFAIIDDFLDKSERDEFEKIMRRVTDILLGREDYRLDHGFYYQVRLIRQDALRCDAPLHLYRQFVDSVSSLIAAYGDEKRHNVAGKPPPLPVYQDIRRQTSGGVCYAKYLCLQKSYHSLPELVLRHPTILRMHDICGSLVGYHNDFVSLPKELARGGDVMNLVISVEFEFGLGIEDAHRKALELHDAHLNEFLYLQAKLPDFGEWHQTAMDYVKDLGTMVQGVYSWHIRSTGRYIPGAYVEPEYTGAQPLII